jgi:hypothetical protein
MQDNRRREVVGEPSAGRTFCYPPAMRRFFLYSSVLSLGTIAFILQSSSLDFLGDTVIFACLVALALCGNLDIHLTEVRLDENGITQRSLIGTRTLRWAEIEEFVAFSRLLLLRGPYYKKQIRLFHGDFGFSIEPFEDLRERILRRVEPNIFAKWSSKNGQIERSYRYPAISFLQCIGYTIALILMVVFFVLAPLSREVFGLEQAVYVMVGAFVVGAFFLRDLRKSRRRILVSANGLRESNQRNILIRWQEVDAIHIKEPILGYGSIVVRGAENRRLTIPVRMRGAGELFFLLTTHGKPQIMFGHDV